MSIAPNPKTQSIALLAVCAAADLAAVPLILGTAKAPAPVGAIVALLGVITALAAVGIAQGRPTAQRVALGTRVVDAATALPGLFAGGPAAVAAGAIIVVSVAAIAALWRVMRERATAALAR